MGPRLESYVALKDIAGEQTLLRSRIVIACVAIGVLLLAVLVRIFDLQVVKYEHFKTRSHDNRVKIVPVPPTRGLIRDRNGVLLAQNIPTYSLEIVPEAVVDLERTLRELRALIEIRDVDEARFHRMRSGKRRFESIPLRTRLVEAEVARFAVNRHRFPGVDVHARLTRDYPLGSLGVHAIGYVGRISEAELESLEVSNYRGTTHTGKTGVERAYEAILHGRVGYSQVETNAQGRILRVLEQTDPVPGRNLYLTVDISLQAVAEAAMEGEVGALVASDPRTGEVLALVSAPGYDPNLFVHGIEVEQYRALSQSPERPLFNRALAGQYPPGSLVKPFLALAGLHEGIGLARGKTFCGGYFQLEGNDHRYRDWKAGGHGPVDLRTAISESCDVYFYSLALELGIDRMHDFMRRFGFGAPAEVDLGGEASGLMPSRAWKRATYRQAWFPGETLITGIGQGFVLVTPIQLASATAALATRGQRVKPRVVQRTEDPSTLEQAILAPQFHPAVDLAPADWVVVTRAMIDVMHSPRGTARAAGRGAEVEIAGKTGTAQVYTVGQDESYDRDAVPRELRDHALFVAFAPADEPTISIAVVIEHGGSGSVAAAPIARKVIDAYFGAVSRPLAGGAARGSVGSGGGEGTLGG